jgi:TPR repeat protein
LASAAIGSDARTDLVAAEGAYTGSTGRVDRARAVALFRAASAAGEPAATAWIAMLEHFGLDGVAKDRAGAARRAAPTIAPLREASRRGDVVSAYALGALQAFGIGTPVDAAAARRLLESADAEGHASACRTLAWMMETGRGAPADLDAAAAKYFACAARGNTAAMRALGRLGYGALSGRISKPEAVGWFRQAAERGDAESIYWMGNILLYGAGVPADRERAIAWLDRVDGEMSGAARYDLAFAHLTADPEGGDRVRAAAELERAASGAEPHVRAMTQLGWLRVVDSTTEEEARDGWSWIDRAAAHGLDQLAYLFGAGESSAAGRRLLDVDLARLERRAAGGSPSAQALLARFGFEGVRSEEPDAARVVALARSAAESGERHAMRLLGQASRSGYGMAADPAARIAWFRRGAEAGETFCMMWLGQILLDGKELPGDRAAGLRWLERSAAAGNYWATSTLGYVYDEGGHDLPRDPRRALPFKRRLAALGDVESIGWMRVHAPEEAP